MKEKPYRIGIFLVLIGMALGCWAGMARAAQSSADVAVSAAEKEKLRREIVGDLKLPGEQKEYVIGHGDIIAVSVYGEGDMTAAVAGGGGHPDMGAQSGGGGGDILRRPGRGAEVRLDGRVSLLHIGDVHLAGMTLTQAADYLKKLYASVYEDPVVTVALVQSNSRRYTVMGQVARPGIYYLDFPLTIVQALARAGGFTEWANHDVTVIRQGNNPAVSGAKGEKALKFDYDDYLDGDDLDRNVYLQPDDVMIVH